MPPIATRIRFGRRALAITLLGALAFAFFLFLARGLVSAPAPKFITAKVVRADVENSVLATGTLQPIRQVDVGTRATGQVQSLKVKLGDHVRAGDLLAEIDPTLAMNAVRGAEARLADLEAQRRSAEARLRKSRLELERQRGMIRGDVTSRRDLESAEAQQQADEANLAALAAQIAQARSQIEIENANLSYTRIAAPIEGEVVGVLAQEGQTVVAAQIVPVILKLARLDAMTIRAQVSEADVIGVKVGQTAFFSIMGDPDRRMSGTIRTVEPAPDGYSDLAASRGSGPSSAASQPSGNAVFYNALFDVANSDGLLRIGMTAQVSIVQSVAKNALAIPSQALHDQRPDGTFSVRVRGAGDRLDARFVRIGVNNHKLAQVLEGLAEGDEIVIQELLPEDTRSAP
jgi:membrane fusion protein, macrolide-specific efflux system